MRQPTPQHPFISPQIQERLDNSPERRVRRLRETLEQQALAEQFRRNGRRALVERMEQVPSRVRNDAYIRCMAGEAAEAMQHLESLAENDAKRPAALQSFRNAGHNLQRALRPLVPRFAGETDRSYEDHIRAIAAVMMVNAQQQPQQRMELQEQQLSPGFTPPVPRAMTAAVVK